MIARQTDGRRAADEGFTLIEVLVALLVFAIISTGILAGITAIVQMTNDNRSRVTAANLASQELDEVRATSDTYTVQSAAKRPIPVDGKNYWLTRTVTWVSSAGSSVSCNSSANLFFLHVNVRVTWDGMAVGEDPVQDDTILAPADGSTNSSLGAINVSIVGFDGKPVQGVAVTVNVATGGPGESPSATKPTTADGCTYANGVKPGNYVVSIYKSGYRDQNGATNPSKTVTVSAGSTSSVQFVYDQAGVINVLFTDGSSATSAAIPAALPVNYTSDGATFSVKGLLAGLFPNAYNVTAGTAKSGSKTCAAIDPSAWVAANVNGVALKAGVTSTVNSLVNVTSTVKVPLGVVNVYAPAGSTLTAIQAAPQGDGNPGCDVRSTLTYSVTGTGTGSWVALALPYGSWTISANGVPLAANAEQVVTNTALPGVSTDGTVTLDPRRAG